MINCDQYSEPIATDDEWFKYNIETHLLRGFTMTKLYYYFSGGFRDGLFHFFIDDEHGLREISKMNYWRWMQYFDLNDILHTKNDVQQIVIP